ncbi:hypothetical protein EV44_g0287 [Erysiphe necator]|uniref:Reverse transcriptase Ty1/copia-type domain-containing protein n=1 Tax=Uncinula necator TaxID=52586 RepID=A0A0B1P2W1_UNCNE|nr:hypothetical protein EV44_g0287 [Erysiphe necator]
MSQRLILALTAILQEKKSLNLYVRDISQAYVQSSTHLNRDFFVKPPTELQMDEGSILRIVKPLYGIPEAGNHCVCQPESAFDLASAAQVTNPKEEDVKTLNKRLQWQINNKLKGLRFIHLNIHTLRLVVFTDASFANNRDLSSQIGFVITLADDSNKANIIHWSSLKCKRVTRSILASELYAVAHGFDTAIVLKSTIEKILQKNNLPLILCADSKSLYDCLVKLGTTQEKRLMVDLMCIRQSYERRQITEIRWIDGNSNPADAMTKGQPCSALTRLIDTNMINITPFGWVERYT